MKVGAMLYCYRVMNMWCDISSNFDIGRSYEVLSIVLEDNMIYVSTNNGGNEWFHISIKKYFDNSEDWYFGHWFYTVKKIRKMKLYYLKSVDTL